MNTIKKYIKKKIEYLSDDTISQEVRNFYVAYLFAVFASILCTIVFIAVGLNPEITKVSLFMCLFSIFSGLLAKLTNEYTLFTYIFVFSFNFFIYPLFFILTADIYNGVPLFLAIGIILTFFLLDGKKLFVIVFFEVFNNSFLVWFAYKFRDELEIYHKDSQMGTGISLCFIIAAFLPMVIVFYQNLMYKTDHDKLVSSNNQMNAISVAKSRFLANMSNEIRTPINAVFGMVEVILKEELNDEAREQAETIKTASAELLNIINNILVYSKLESNKMELIPVRYNFRDMINDVIYSVVLEHSAEKNDFSVYVDHNIPNFIYGDDIRIKQVFRYLLFSSIHQLPHSRVFFDVRCETNKKDHSVTFKCNVSESGRGLTDSEIKAVFGGYNEYDSRQRSDFKGMGLELFICREILNLMNGSLKIESIPGIGMSIIFEFTNYVLDDEIICEVEDSNNKSVLIYLDNKNKENNWKPLMENLKVAYNYASGLSQFKQALEEKKYTHVFISDADYDSVHKIIESSGCEEYTYVVTDYQHVYEDFGKCKIVRRPIYSIPIADILNNKWNKELYLKPNKREEIIFPDAKVLVVDDNVVNLKVLLSILEKYKIKADMATSGEGCLNILKDKKYDLLLLDQLMPGLNGTETLQKLKKSDGINSDIPVICITADFGADVRERLIAEGFQDYLAKPVKAFYLDRMLRKYLPDDLMILGSNKKEETPVKEQNKDEVTEDKHNTSDPLEINVLRGIELVGGSEEVYNTILATYYQEGMKKLDEIPEQSTAQDLALYSTNVHALKSSSASIGATNISERFKALEFAGKAGNREIVERDTPETLDFFRQLLTKIYDYMKEHNIPFEDDFEPEDLPSGDEMKLESDIISDLQKNLANVNLKYCEDAINNLCNTNYGREYNSKINEIRKKFEQFDYRSVKTLLEELYNMVS